MDEEYKALLIQDAISFVVERITTAVLAGDLVITECESLNIPQCIRVTVGRSDTMLYNNLYWM